MEDLVFLTVFSNFKSIVWDGPGSSAGFHPCRVSTRFQIVKNDKIKWFNKNKASHVSLEPILIN